MTKTMILTGDNNIPALPMTEAQVNHLRRLLAWLRCAYMLDEHMQRGFMQGAALSVQHGAATPERAGEILQQQADKINQVPAYVRQAHKMLSKALLEHDKRSGVVEGCRSGENLQAMPVSEKPAGAAGAKRIRRNQ
ncbi:hypothetical protein [Comamonas koreensis]|uniref:Uncharacterized protein n=1 Tax=Comamonas koreensis TaxID=160825 RepID=A0AAW4XXN0_9BURK|nr:hypothetical protein [Comamonas koreensis]MCD2165574.1 hypothetical protein [Comamonas koreensis]